MYEEKVGRAYGRGCLRSCLVSMIGAVLGVAMVGTVLVVIRGGDVEPRSGRLALALAVPFVFMALLVVAGALVVAVRGRRLDRAFSQWGLEGRQTGGVMRDWHGEVEGRRLDAWFHKGPTLELYLSCRPATRGVIHRGGRLARALARAFEPQRPLEPPPMELDGAVFVAADGGWLRRLLAGRRAESAVRSLMTETRRAAVAVFFAPNAVRYLRRFMPVAEITPENLRVWVEELSEIAAAVDALGPSSNAARESRMEEWARLRRGRFLNRFYLILGAVTILLWSSLFLFGWLFAGTP